MALYRERPSPDMRQPLGRKLRVRWRRQGGRGIDASGFAAKKVRRLAGVQGGVPCIVSAPQ
ncbi:hypothetical protein [Rothia aeria]|uniref:hypothetical protein n=1 Tax=Rothia aeria TaxID=172042 RepID=UPI001C58C908|nr:hypothetical protein [Rothia aeria]QXW91941.1 hypothetical protein LPB401_07730 [Rothia aeria]